MTIFPKNSQKYSEKIHGHLQYVAVSLYDARNTLQVTILLVILAFLLYPTQKLDLNYRKYYNESHPQIRATPCLRAVFYLEMSTAKLKNCHFEFYH